MRIRDAFSQALPSLRAQARKGARSASVTIGNVTFYLSSEGVTIGTDDATDLADYVKAAGAKVIKQWDYPADEDCPAEFYVLIKAA